MATWVTSLALVKGASGSEGIAWLPGLGVENRHGCYEIPRLWLRWLVPQEICAARGCGSSVQKRPDPPLCQPTSFQGRAGLVNTGGMSVPAAADHEAGRHDEKRSKPKRARGKGLMGFLA